MEELLKVLHGLKFNIDFENEENLIETGLLDSLDIVAMIDAIQDHFKIELNGDDIDLINFESTVAMWRMIEKYMR